MLTREKVDQLCSDLHNWKTRSITFNLFLFLQTKKNEEFRRSFNQKCFIFAR